MGVDMASKAELIASQKSLEEIRAFIGVDSLAYLSIDGMMETLRADDGYCNACFHGTYPFATPLLQMELELNDKEKFDGALGSS